MDPVGICMERILALKGTCQVEGQKWDLWLLGDLG